MLVFCYWEKCKLGFTKRKTKWRGGVIVRCKHNSINIFFLCSFLFGFEYLFIQQFIIELKLCWSFLLFLFLFLFFIFVIAMSKILIDRFPTSANHWCFGSFEVVFIIIHNHQPGVQLLAIGHEGSLLRIERVVSKRCVVFLFCGRGGSRREQCAHQRAWPQSFRRYVVQLMRGFQIVLQRKAAEVWGWWHDDKESFRRRKWRCCLHWTWLHSLLILPRHKHPWKNYV